MWRYFYENKNANIENVNFKLSFDAKLVSTTQLTSINSAIDNELRLFFTIQNQMDPQYKLLNIVRIGDIGLKIRKIIVENQLKWSDPDNPLNDNMIEN